MPAEILQPLAVRFTLPGGVVHLGALHDLPDPSLAADLAAGLAAATHPARTDPDPLGGPAVHDDNAPDGP